MLTCLRFNPIPAAILVTAFIGYGAAGNALAETVISDFDAQPPGSFNPRDIWFAFGAGTLDMGVINDGSVGKGAYHSVNWGGATFGIGEGSTQMVDLSGFDAIEVDARIVDTGGHSGTAMLRFALDLPAGTEWSTSATPLTGAYATYTFDLSTMTRTAGGGPLDLVNGTPKFIVEKNGQSGSARFDMDEIVGVTDSGGPFQLLAVTLNNPPDGDPVRAMWMYAFANDLKVDNSADAQAVLDFCASEGVNRIYFGAANAWNGSLVLRNNLRTFIATAHQSGIRVEALIDGISEYQNVATIESWIDDVLAFHNETPADDTDDFDAIHFDMEFWLSSAWTGAANESARQDVARLYLDNVLVTARNRLDAAGLVEMPVGTDLSSHFDTVNMLPSPMLYDGSVQCFNEHVLDNADDVVFMSYIDFESGLLDWTDHELDLAAGKGRRIQIGADIAPVPPEVPINSFADNFAPTPFSSMTKTLELYHTLLTPTRLAALDGVSVFHYDHYAAQAPQPRNVADLDADGDADEDDYGAFESFADGPGVAAAGLAKDGDLDDDGNVTLLDFAVMMRCNTGAGVTGPIPDECIR